MAAPVASSIIYALSLLVISLFVLQLLRYFLPLRTTPAYILVPVFLAVALPANLILLVPIDLASNPSHHDQPYGIWLPERALLIAWRISYWLTFALTWFILPILGEYVDSGDREPKDKLLYSLRSNGRYHLMVLAAALLGAVYFILTEGFNFTSLKALVMALAYAWGLVLAIYLMGHGLVAVPRRLMRDADTGRRLTRLQSQAPKLYEKLLDASDELEQYEVQVDQLQKRRAGTAKHLGEWILELAESIRLPGDRAASVGALPQQRTAVPPVLTPRYLADLTRKLRRAKHKHLRYTSEWRSLLESVARAQAVLDAKPSRKLVFPNSKDLWLSPPLRYHLHATLRPTLSYLGAGVLSLASVSIVWSELTKYFIPGISLVRVTVVPTSAERVTFFPSQIFAAFWISYMSACALYSVSVLPMWGNRALVCRTTYLESATWYAGQVAKLTVPLAYNFLTFLPRDVRTRSMFYRFLGVLVDLTPLGRGFDGFFPILLIFPALAALFGFYNKIKNVFGFGDLLQEDDEEDQWREGKILIDRELRERGTRQSLSIGLSESPSRGRSLDVERNQRAASSARPARDRRNGRRPLVSALGEEEGEEDEERGEGNFFTEFAHRVRNTFDTTDSPSWFRRPDWMGGGHENRDHGISEPRNWGRMFGGRANEGRVRI